MPSAIRKQRTATPKAPQTVKAREQHEASLRDAMVNLLRNPHFADFIGELRDMRENAIMDSLNDAVADSDRLTLVAKGEIRAYTEIVRLYDEAFLKLSEETQNVEPFSAQG